MGFQLPTIASLSMKASSAALFLAYKEGNKRMFKRWMEELGRNKRIMKLLITGMVEPITDSKYLC